MPKRLDINRPAVHVTDNSVAPEKNRRNNSWQIVYVDVRRSEIGYLMG